MHASHDIGRDRIAGGGLRNTKIRHLYLAFLGNNDILRLDIPVDNVIVMCRLYSHGNLNGNAHRLLDGKSGLLLYIFFEGNSLHKFHDNVVILAFLAHIINIDDIGVHKSRRRLGFDSEL